MNARVDLDEHSILGNMWIYCITLKKDNTSDWKDFQKVCPKPYFISTDFTNDGFTDEAWILFITDSSTRGLFVFLKKACGNGYWDCKDNEPPILTLKYPAIDFFKYESANSVFYWDTQLKAFKRIWMSD
jgi:hypothetical protein